MYEEDTLTLEKLKETLEDRLNTFEQQSNEVAFPSLSFTSYTSSKAALLVSDLE